MAIRRLKVSNFRSFNELDVELGDFNVLIGANASGKSNFIEIFRFLRDIQRHGLRDALSLQGGSDYVQNLQLGASKPLGIDVTNRARDIEDYGHRITLTDNISKLASAYVREMTYGFSIQASERDNLANKESWQVDRDEIHGSFTIHASRFRDAGIEVEDEVLGNGEFLSWQDSEGPHTKLDLDPWIRAEYFPSRDDFSPFTPITYIHQVPLPGSDPFPRLLVEDAPLILGRISGLGIYRTDPLASQHAQPVRVPSRLTDDASNLAAILDRILSDNAKRRNLLNLVEFLLPFIENIFVQRFTDESLLLHTTEKYAGGKRLHAGLMSEGTIAAIALVVVLYFEDSPLVIFEDPDRGMHPKLMARVVEMMKEVSEHKQIIVTTHHPEMVRYAGVENLLFVSRDKNGFSQVTRPADKGMVKQFLANDIGLDRLYVDDLLEV